MIRETLWERELHQRGSASSFLVTEDCVVVHERRTRLVCLDREDGSVRWDAPIGTWPRNLVIADGRCLVLPQSPNLLSCLDLRTGAALWHVELPRFSGHVVTVTDTVLVGGWRGYTPLAAFDLRDGRPLWQTPLPAHTALPLSWGGGVLLGHGPEAWLIDPRDGSEMIRWQLPEPLTDGELRPVFTAVGPDHCLARCGPGSLMLLQLSSGAVDELIRHDADLVAEAAVFVGGVVWLRQPRAGYLAADPNAGSTLWRVDVGQPLVSGVIQADDGFVVASEGALFRLRPDGQVMERSPHAHRISALRDLGDGEMIVTTRGTLKALVLESRQPGE
ncbi:PQQ-binding-like beta-propeller repeat protein [Kitasatospora sp. NPDC056731]|uniref:outer membrane protein assembly factor BamB family protein n=1 Tax=Kitasatospora sp. NPDC056731 TaxID=3155422 RepID=UPI00342E7129